MTDRLEVRATLAIAPDTRSPARARAFIRDFCSAAGLSADVCETAALLTSELVTNAIRYGGSEAILEAHVPGEVLRVAVRDNNPALPEVGEAPPPNAESGRGILIVSAIAPRWGVQRLDGGKAVWFELDL